MVVDSSRHTPSGLLTDAALPSGTKPATGSCAPLILSFDVEEHYRIEAAAHLKCPPDTVRIYSDRMEHATRNLLDLLAEQSVPATFFIIGQIAVSHPKLVADVAAAGHEIGSHGWDHQRVHRFTPSTFRDDIRNSKDALEQASGTKVVGYRAPTFSVDRTTGWAIDVLAEEGMRYDSSVFPVLHDRYGVPDAPRTPFVAEGRSRSLLEVPPVTYRVLGRNLPAAGGGYFRLFPPAFIRAGIRQLAATTPAVGMLYFHPWEFDPDQPRLPLGRLARWRTYVGVHRSSARLRELLDSYQGRFRRAIDIVEELEPMQDRLPRYRIAT